MVRSKKSFLLLNTLLVACLLIGGNAVAQTTLVIVEGTVTDEQGSSLPGASVSFREIMTGFSRSTLTRFDGYYRLSGLHPGEYEAEVSLDGFQTRIRKGMSFSVGAKLKIDFVLSATALEEEVIVVGEAPMVEVTKSEVSTVVDRIKIDSLPLLDRDYGALTSLKAGTTIETVRRVRANAQPAGSEEILTDGVSNKQALNNVVRSLIPADAIKEFRVITNQYEAEYGNASGIVRSAITRSGTDNFRGRLAFFTRFEGIDNPNYFVNHDGYQGEEIPRKEYEDDAKYKHYNWSGFLGGPLKKEKAHFFVLYEGISHEEYTTVTSPLEPGTFPYQEPRTQILAKADYQFSEKSHMIFRYSFDKPDIIDYVQGGLYTYTTGASYKQRIHEFQLNWTYYASDNTMNEMRFLYSDWLTEIHSIEDGKYDYTYHIVRPSGHFNSLMNVPVEGSEKWYQFVDNISLFAGDHSLKFGIDASYISEVATGNIFRPGLYFFSTNEDFDPNIFSTYPIYLWSTQKIWEGDIPSWIVGIFAQDSWRVNDRLTLNFGLRYNYYTVQFMDYKTFDIRHFNPRFGFSYDPVGDGKTAIRGGIGTYSQNPVVNLGVGVDYSKLTVQLTIFPGYPDPSVPNPFVPPTEVEPPTDSVQSSPNMIYPYSMQATLGFQREFLKDLSIGFDLVYTRGYKFTRMENDNPIIPGTGILREDMTKGNLWIIRPNGKSDYKALFVTLSKRYSNGWSLDIAYTLSRSWSDVEGISDYYWLEEDLWEKMYGPTDFDRAHRISFMGIVDLPAGFQVSSTGYYMSSQPYSEFYAEDQNLDGVAKDLLPSNPHRNFRRKFDYLAINLRLSWFLNIDRFRLQLIGEVYNVTDRTNFYFMDNFTREGDTFGHPTAAYDPRRFQFGIRFDF